MKILILGESGKRGGQPWREGRSSEKLRRWFGVSCHDELSQLATLMNVRETGGTPESNVEHYKLLRDAIVSNDLVFLVGKVAQHEVFRAHPTLRLIFWQQNKYAGLPHPSGLNRQLNGVRDRDVREFIMDVMQRYLRETHAIINRLLEGQHDP